MISDELGPRANDAELEGLAEILEASGRYKVLRKIALKRSDPLESDGQAKNGLFVDVETTGLDSNRDEAIELAMVPFTYSTSGKILAVGNTYQAFQKPARPIPPNITRLTGITDEIVDGKNFDREEISCIAQDADLIIAHNANFDRPFLERISEVFCNKPWACSMNQIDWANEGYEGSRLSYLVADAGYFYDRHRAENDCIAAIELLRTKLKKSDVPAMARLLENARKVTWRLWAEGSPYDLKDVLKSRGYRWNGDSNLLRKGWYVDLEESALPSEVQYLRNEIYQREMEPFAQRIDAYSRVSGRA